MAAVGAEPPAQNPGSISGTVSNKGGQVIEGAVVTVSGAGGIKRTVTSDDWGNYQVADLPAGSYDLSVSAQGFQTLEVKGVVVKAGEIRSMDALLPTLAEAAAAAASAPSQDNKAPAAAHASSPANTASPNSTPAEASAPAPQENASPAGTSAFPTPLPEPVQPQVAASAVASAPGTVSGAVTDPSGALVVGAVVTISNANGVKQTVTSNAQGNYSVSGLAPGTYDLSVSAPGFKTFETKGLVVTAEQGVVLDTMLEAAGEKTEIEVQSEAAARVETENAQVSGTITEKEVVKLGLNGRNFTQLIALAPGVSNQTGQDEAKVGVQGSVKYSVNGGRVEYNNFVVDGSDVLNTGINGSDSTLVVYPSLDAIQEVKVLTSNYGAEYGRTASGTVVVTTKSGTAQFHGSGYEFLRNEAFNARNFFDLPGRTPLYRRHDFGGTLGGPLFIPGVYNTKRDKTYFFVSEEFRLEKSPFEYNQAVPSLAERGGDFSDVCPDPVRDPENYPLFAPSAFPDCPHNGGLTANGKYQIFTDNRLNNPVNGFTLERNALAILNTGVIPPPNATTGCNSTTLSCYVTTVSPPTYWREELFRIDHDFTSKLRGTFRYIHDSWDTTVPTPQWGIIHNTFPTIENRFVGPGISIVGRLTHTISPSLLNEFAVSFVDSHITLTDIDGPGTHFLRPGALDAPCAPDPNPPNPSNPILQCPIGYLFNNGFGGKMPGIVIGGTNLAYGGSGFAVDASYMPWDHVNPTYTFSDTLSKVVGKHTLQFGGQLVIYRRDQTNGPIGAATGDVQGILTFSNVNSLANTGNAFANFLLEGSTGEGRIQSFTQDSAQHIYHQRYTVMEPYFQDDWRVSPRLTVNMGLRLSLFGTFHEAMLNAYNWVPSAFDAGLAAQARVDTLTGQLLAVPGGKPIPLDPNNPDPRLTNGLVQCGKNGVPDSCMQGHLFNPAPRIGFAWDPKGDGKTSIRAGYGVFFEHGTANEANTGSLEGSSPLVLNITQNNPSGWSCIGGVGDGCVGAGAYPLNVTAIPTKAIWPYVQQWSLSVQRDLPLSMVATFAYVGSKGTHLTAQRQLNQLAPVNSKFDTGLFLTGNPFGPNEPLIPAIDNSTGDCSGFTGTAFVLRNGTHVTQDQPAYLNLLAACFGTGGPGEFPDTNSLRTFAPTLGRIVSLENIADSKYNAFQATLRRTAGKLTLGLSYSYSHSLDDASDRSDASFVNSFDLASNKASSNFDERHLLSVSYVYDLPNLRGIGSKLRDLAYGSDAGDSDQTEGAPSKTPMPDDDAGWVNRLLGNWEISGITVFQSGTPFSVINGGGVNGISVLDNAGVANGAGAGSYPDLLRNPTHILVPAVDNPRSFGPLLLNPNMFAAPRGLTFGNAGRNPLNNPHRLNFDMALLKHFRISESKALEFRAEAFNIFNTTQFMIFDPNRGNTGSNVISCYGGPKVNYSAAGGDGVDCITGSSFLHPVSAHRPRTIQLGLKLAF